MDVRFCDLDSMIVFAKNSNGNLAFVDDVPNGYDCGCFCINCGNKLSAKNRGGIKAHHFAHVAGSDCKKGHESTIAFFIKRILERTKWMLLPNGTIRLNGQTLNDCQKVAIKKVGLKQLEGYPPAVVVTTMKDLDIGIYIDFVDDDWINRRFAYQSLFDSLIEIDLRSYRGSELGVEKELETILHHKDHHVRWIKRYDETRLANIIREKAVWKTFGKDINGREHIYCPKTKAVSTTFEAECDFCNYRLNKILSEGSGLGCLGFIDGELSTDKIMAAEKPDYSSIEGPTFFDMNSIYRRGCYWFYLSDLPAAYPDIDYCLVHYYDGEKVFFVNLKSFTKQSIIGLRIDEDGNRSDRPSYLSRIEESRSWRICSLANFKINQADIDFLDNVLRNN